MQNETVQSDFMNRHTLIPYESKYYKHISSRQRKLDFKFRELWTYRDLILLFVKRNFTVTYKQTVIGPAWVLINPLLTSIMHMILFGNIAGLSTGGIPQILFYFFGSAVWDLFSGCLTSNSSVFLDNMHVFGKVYFPRMAVPVSSVISAIIRFGIKLALIILLMIWYGIHGMIAVNWLYLWILPVGVIQLALMGMAIGILVSSMTTKYRDLGILVMFGVTLWMYGTPVVYPLSELAEGTLRNLICLNPVTAPIEMIRWALLNSGTVMWGSWLLTVLFTVMILLFSISVFNRVERRFLDTI